MKMLSSVYLADSNSHWHSDKKSPCRNSDDHEDQSPVALQLGRKSKKNHSLKKVEKLFKKVGHQLESLIDSSFLGVAEPQPWDPLTDKKAEALSNPVQTTVQSTVDFLTDVCQTIEGLMAMPHGNPIQKNLNFDAAPFFAALVCASQKMLTDIRQGLANAVREEKAMGESSMVDELGLDDYEECPSVFTECEEEEFINTSDISVEEDAKPFEDYEDIVNVNIPSIEEGTEIIFTEDLLEKTVQETEEEDTEVITLPETTVQVTEVEDTEVITFTENLPETTVKETEDDEYVITEEPQSDDDEYDFVDVRSEFEIAWCP